MVIKYLYCCLFLLFGVTKSYSQKVSNVSNRQEQSTIVVSYELDTKSPCKIELYVSTNGGTTWQGPLKKVSGNVGVNVSSGNKSITWNVLEEFEELRGTNIMFQVRSEDLNIDTIQIGNQVWTKKNLEVSTYRNGDIIPEVKDPSEWAKLTTGAWCYYNNDTMLRNTYGKLYNWYAVNDPRGLAPEGFHVPSDTECYNLIKNLGGESVVGGKLKEIGYKHWKIPNGGASNSSGFIGLPGGSRYSLGSFMDIGVWGYWWSSTLNNENFSWYFYLYAYSEKSSVSTRDKKSGFSVRCVKD